MFRFKPLIFAVMCVFTLSACETAGINYHADDLGDKTGVKDVPEQNDNVYLNVMIGLAILTVVGYLILGGAVAKASAQPIRTCTTNGIPVVCSN